jgi:hypothetical protein
LDGGLENSIANQLKLFGTRRQAHFESKFEFHKTTALQILAHRKEAEFMESEG